MCAFFLQLIIIAVMNLQKRESATCIVAERLT